MCVAHRVDISLQKFTNMNWHVQVWCCGDRVICAGVAGLFVVQ